MCCVWCAVWCVVCAVCGVLCVYGVNGRWGFLKIFKIWKRKVWYGYLDAHSETPWGHNISCSGPQGPAAGALESFFYFLSLIRSSYQTELRFKTELLLNLDISMALIEFREEVIARHTTSTEGNFYFFPPRGYFYKTFED